MREEEKEEEEDMVMEEEEDEEEVRPTRSRGQRNGNNKRSGASKRRSSVVEEVEDMGIEEEKEDQDEGDGEMMFSSQVPELSQEIAPVRAGDRNNLYKMGQDAREKAIGDLLQLVLFKGLAREPIDRPKVIKEAGISDARISSAAFTEVNQRLEQLFDFKLSAVPAFMQEFKDFPTKYKDRYFLLNIADDADGSHSRALHGASPQGIVEKGLLMIVLAFIFCKGEPRSDGSRWLVDTELYALLHKVDDNLHPEPPNRNAHKKRGIRGSATSSSTPDVDALLDKFVHMDYLWVVKDNEQLLSLATNASAAGGGGGGSSSQAAATAPDESSLFYSMGPRAALEIGRRQVIHFCADILDQEPDPSMFEGIEDENEEEAMEESQEQ